MLTVPPRFTPGALVGVADVHRNAHADLGAGAEPQEIHVHRQILHRVELEVARDDPMRRAIHVELVDAWSGSARHRCAP